MNDSVNPNRPRRALPLRPLAKPVIVTVRTDEHGEPTHVRLPGKTARRVDTVRERWRIDDEWWRERISRRYFRVTLAGGVIRVIF